MSRVSLVWLHKLSFSLHPGELVLFYQFEQLHRVFRVLVGLRWLVSWPNSAATAAPWYSGLAIISARTRCGNALSAATLSHPHHCLDVAVELDRDNSNWRVRDCCTHVRPKLVSLACASSRVLPTHGCLSKTAPTQPTPAAQSAHCSSRRRANPAWPKLWMQSPIDAPDPTAPNTLCSSSHASISAYAGLLFRQ